MRIERLSSEHDRSQFDCGKAPLNEYLQRYASQNDKRNNTRTFVALPDDSERVIGYHVNTVKEIEPAVVPADEKLGGYPMPAVLIARLAVDQGFQGQGIGKRLLIDALKRIVRASTTVGLRAVVVDAKDDEAKAFYEHYGFRTLLDDPRHLYLPLKVLLNSRLVTPDNE